MRMSGRAFVLLIVAVAGIVSFSRGLRLVDTIGLLASGVLAGVALAEIAAARTRRGPSRPAARDGQR